MSTIRDLFQQAQMAEAAYASFFDNAGNLLTTNAGVITALQREGFSESQATAFVQNWRVVSQFSENGVLSNGFSAALFERLDANQQPTGQYTLAIAGSTQFVDFAGTDLDLAATGVAHNQLVSMLNYVLRLKVGASGITRQLNFDGTGLTSNFVNGVGPGIDPSRLTISGHSLGGYLGQVYQRILGSTGVYTYNALGLTRPNDPIFDRLTNLLGLPTGSFSSGPGENLLVPGEPAQLIGRIQGNPQMRVFSETQSIRVASISTISAHKIPPLTDSLAVYNLLATLDSSLNTANLADGLTTITGILNAASNVGANTLESLISELGKLFSVSGTTFTGNEFDTNRDKLYTSLSSINQALSGRSGLHLVSLSAMSAARIASIAGTPAEDNSDKAFRYALKELNPFVVSGVDYGQLDQHGELDLYNAAGDTPAGMTTQYLADRAAMLAWKNLDYTADGQRALRSKQPLTYDFTDKTLKDANGNDLTFMVVGTQSSTVNAPAKIVFGSDRNETLTGGDVYLGDHLYGGGGDDTLIGNGGSDYLEGGQGIDTYVYSSDDGQDTILDTDGLGTIVFNGVTLAGGAMFAGEYISLDKEFRYAFHGDLTTGGTLVINGDLRIENFRNGDLGITLGNPGSLADLQPASRIYRGDLNQFYGSDGDDHFIAGTTAIFLGKGGDDLLVGNNWDYLIGGAGDDVITAGSYFEFGENTGVLVLSGGAGSDIILGGEVGETIYGDMEQAVISPDGNSFHIDRFWFNSETAFGELFEGQYANAQYDNPFAAFSSDFADTTIYFFGGIDEALNYILGISASTDLSTLYDDFIDGGDGNDQIWGGFGSDMLFGGEGNDEIRGDINFSQANLGIYANLFGLPGDDYLDGGGGNDTLNDNEGNDTFIAGDGNDTVSNFDPLNGTITYENYLQGDDGNDVLSSENRSVDGFDTLLGGAGDDALTSEYGSALLDGGTGNDIYAISRGHVGQITIQDHDSTPGNLDRLVFGTLIPADEGDGAIGIDANWNLDDGILPSEVGITRDESNLYLSLNGVEDSIVLLNWFVSDADRIEEVMFQDGTVWDVAALTAMATNADPIHGTPDDDLLVGIAGARNTLIGDAGDDTLAGSSVDDVLNGEAGNDFLAGGAGNDTYVFNPGDGVDHIQDDAGANTLQFGAGVTPGMLTLGLGSLSIHVGSGGDTIHLDDFDAGDVFGIHTIDTFRFADGTSLTYNQLVARGFEINGTDGDDLLTGTNVNDRFDGGRGNDTLIGSAGNDTYLFGRGSGQDRIEDYDASVGNSDTLRVGAAVTPGNLVISRINDDLLIKIDGTQDQVAITNWFLGSANVIERIQFSDGTTWDAATLESHIAPVNHPPLIANPINNQSLNEDAPFRFQIPANTFADIDAGDVLRFTATLENGSTLPSWLTFDAATRSLNGTPANGDVGSFRVRITATDSGNASVSDTFDLTVINANDAPIVNHAIVDQGATVGSEFALPLAANTFTDIDVGDTLTYSARLLDGSNLPAWLAFDSATCNFSGTPGNGDEGVYSIRVTATDSGNLSAFDIFGLTVSAAPAQDLVGTIGNNVLTGGAGDDTLNGGGGSDRLVGNGGNDTFHYFGDATWSTGLVARNDGRLGNRGTGRIGAMSGKNRSFDVFLGGPGEDVLLGTSGDDVLFLEDPDSPFPSGAEPRISGIERIEMGDGGDIVNLIGSHYTYGDVTLDGGNGNDVLWASSGDDVLLGGAGNDDLFGGAGRDYLSGGPGNDTINGDHGNDLIEGGDGNDALADAFGNNLFYAGRGNDKAIGGSGNELFIGGKGNDTIVTGQGADIIAFNRGDGRDTITGGTNADNTLSLGGGIRYQDLYLSQQGNNLVLETGNQDRIVLQNWYSSPANRGVQNLQIVAAAMNDFAPAGGDPLRDNMVERFDFQSIVRQFDQARIANPSVNHWAAMDALLDAHLGGSDTEALGGDLAYRYGLSGSLAGIGTSAAQDILAGLQFGAAPQGLRPLASLTEGIVKLG